MPTLTHPTPLQGAVLLPRAEIRPGPHNPRTYFDPTQMEELRDSIAQMGLLEPLLVRYDPSRYNGVQFSIICGERRWRACEDVLDLVPCIIKNVSEKDAELMTFAENVQRRDLTASEEAAEVKRLIEEQSLDVPQIMERYNKSRGWVENRLSYIKTKPDVQAVGARVTKAMTKLVLVDQVKSPEKRAELLNDIEHNYAPTTEIKSKVDAIKSAEAAQAAAAEFAARSQTAPDSETASRSNAAARGESSGMSRGERVTGPKRNEANDQVNRALGSLAAWVSQCDGPTHLKAQELARRILRGDLSR